MSRHWFSTQEDAPDAPDTPDEALQHALRDALPQPPLDDVDWSGLHARVQAVAAARLAATPLAARGRTAAALSWWQPLAGWSPFGIPAAAAATVLLVIAGAALLPARTPGVALTTPEFLTVEEELASGVATGIRPLLAGLDPAAMLDAALFYDGEEW
jgi:hypothetical protein